MNWNLSWTPKFHCLVDHSLDQYKSTRGYKELQEDFVERLHQDGNTAMKQLASVHDYITKAQSFGRLESIRTKKEIVNKRKSVKVASKRKVSEMTTLNKQNKERVRRQKQHHNRQKAITEAKDISPTQMKSGYARQVELVEKEIFASNENNN